MKFNFIVTTKKNVINKHIRLRSEGTIETTEKMTKTAMIKAIQEDAAKMWTTPKRLVTASDIVVKII